MLVISIQSQVVHGHVGNSAAVFPMQAAGLTVAAVPTTLLSNHPHYPTMRGQVLDPELVADLLLGIEERGLIEAATVIVTGYLGSPEIASIVADFVRRARHRNPDLLYICDPVMGDDDLGVFVADGLPDIFRNPLVPLASIITPNQFELELLAGCKARSVGEVLSAAQKLCAGGTGKAVVTGCSLDDTPSEKIETIVYDPPDLHRIGAIRLPIRPCGTGDLFTAFLVIQLSQGGTLVEASRWATDEMSAVLARTKEVGTEEMQLIEIA